MPSRSNHEPVNPNPNPNPKGNTIMPGTKSKKQHPVQNPEPVTTTAATSSAKTKKRQSAPREAPPLITGVSLPASTTPASSGPTPTTPGVSIPVNPIVAASAAALASNATSLQAAVTAPAVPTAADDPPAVTFPSVPATFTPIPLDSFRGQFPNSFKLGGMRQAVLDLNGFADYPQRMGGTVESAPAIASRITRALAWREIRNATEAWEVYVKVEDGLAWQETTAALDELRPSFLLAVSKTPSLATQYPGLMAIFGAGKVIAKKAAITKAKNAKAKAASAAGTASAATTAPIAPAAAPIPATTAPIAPAAAPVKGGVTGS